MNILDKIVEHKKTEVEASKKQRSLADLEALPYFKRQTFSLRKFLLDPNRTGIIAEFKRMSPSKGVINDSSTVEEITTAYAMHASGISVLTDERFFGGTLRDLVSARIHDVPLLRKDFIIDEYQVTEAKAFGADVILLIAACLDKTQVAELSSRARELGLEVLFEVHNEKEIEKLSGSIDMVGVNNRDLGSFEVSIQTSFNLVNKIPSSMLAIAESGISNVETIVSLRQAGFKGFLIGENFMKNADPAIAFAEFVQQLKAKT